MKCNVRKCKGHVWTYVMLLNDSVQMPSDRREKPTSKVKDKSPKNPEGETVQIITKDLIRNLR